MLLKVHKRYIFEVISYMTTIICWEAWLFWSGQKEKKILLRRAILAYLLQNQAKIIWKTISFRNILIIKKSLFHFQNNQLIWLCLRLWKPVRILSNVMYVTVELEQRRGKKIRSTGLLSDHHHRANQLFSRKKTRLMMSIENVKELITLISH